MPRILQVSYAPPSLRLEVAPNGRYLRDAVSQLPFQVRGSSTWCICQNSREDAITVLDNTKSKKFNSIVMMSALSSNALAQYGPPQAYGLSPFTDSKLTPNENYWAHIDYIIREAGRRGLVVQLAFLYLGHAQAQDGFQSRVAGCTSGECTAFGQFLGARYASTPNIIWIAGGDNLSNWTSNWDAIVAGIQSQDTSHLFSGHPARAQEGRQFGSFVNLNSAYRARTEVASGTLTAYQQAIVRPVLGFEYQYEGDGTDFSNPNLTAAQTRTQSWQALLSGACGANYGNHPVWTAGYVNGVLKWPNWMTSQGLDTDGHYDMVHLADFFDRIRWEQLVPDANSAFATTGRSSVENYVAAAYTNRCGVALITPGTSVRFDKSVFSGPLLVRLFDPSNGAWTVLNNSDSIPLSNSGTLDVDPPNNAAGDADMVALFEAAA